MGGLKRLEIDIVPSAIFRVESSEKCLFINLVGFMVNFGRAGADRVDVVLKDPLEDQLVPRFIRELAAVEL
jgi:hypothetical protein